MKKIKFFKILSLILFIGLTTACAIVFFPNGKIKDFFLENFPLPIGKVGEKNLTSKSAIQKYKSISSFAKILGISGKDIYSAAENSSVNDLKLWQIAEKVNAIPSDTEYEAELDRILNQLNGEEIKALEFAEKKSGLEKKVFLKNIFLPRILEDRIKIKFFQSPTTNPESYKEAEMIYNKIKEGASFQLLAADFSQDDASKIFFGDLGEVRIENLYPEVLDTLANLNTGEIQTVFSRNGAFLVKLEDAKKTSENNLFDIKIIMLKSNNFDTWIKNQKSEIKVTLFKII